MPIYEYRCETCGKKTSKLWRSMSAIHESSLVCQNPKCNSTKLHRVVSRVRVVRGGGAGDGSATGGTGDFDEALMRELEHVDENNPRDLGRVMRKMAAASGEDLGDEFNEVVTRLEKGDNPDNIERDMGDLMGGAAGMGGMEDDYGYSGGAPESPSKENAAEEKADQEKTAKKKTVAMGKTSKRKKK